MIYVSNTPNNTGVAIYGDHLDFEALYEALHIVGGNGEERVSFETARIRVLGLCYDLRHAIMGDREFEYVDNGLDSDKMKRLAMIAPGKNLYLKIYVLWPEMLFIMMALNDIVRYYARKQAKSYDMMLDKRNIWDMTLAQVRILQAAVAKCIKETAPPNSHSRMMNMLYHEYNFCDGYFTQYLDILNCRFLDLDKEKRVQSLPIMAKRLTELGKEYSQVAKSIIATAKAHHCSVEDIRPTIDYPEEIDW